MNLPPVELRPASSDDLASIVDVFWACWTCSYPSVLPAATIARLDRSGAEELWSDVLSAAPAGSVVVAGRDAAVVGVVRTSGDLVNSLYVHPDRQGCGVGALLLAVAEEQIAAGGHGTGRLWVFERNGPSRRFYAAHGWTPDGTTHRDERFDEPEIGLAKALAPR